MDRMRGLPGGGRIGRESIDEGVRHAHKGDEEVLLDNGSFGLQFASRSAREVRRSRTVFVSMACLTAQAAPMTSTSFLPRVIAV